MFIRVKEFQCEEELLLNINTISVIFEDGTIVTNGIHGSKDGLYHLEPKSLEKLIKQIEVIEN